MGSWVRNLHGIVAVRDPDGKEEARRGRERRERREIEGEWGNREDGREDVRENRKGCRSQQGN